MKKLTKLNINPEKLMKNEELVILRGGYDCGSGSDLYYCDLLYCEGCSWDYHLPACIPDEINYVKRYVMN